MILINALIRSTRKSMYSTVRRLILVCKADLCIFKTYRYFVVMLYILELNDKSLSIQTFEAPLKKIYAEYDDYFWYISQIYVV